MEKTAALPRWMTMLADEARVRVLRVLENEELSVADLCGVLQLPQSTVSRHLKALADEAWVAARPDGTSRLYRMAVEEMEPVARQLWDLVRDQTSGTRRALADEQRLAAVLAARQSRSQAFFSTAAGQWDRMRREMFGERFDLIALAGLLDDDWCVGDLGCGTGQIAATVAPFVRQVVAVDSSREMLKAARQRLARQANVEVRQGRLESLPIESSELDAAVSCLVLHHVREPARALDEAARVLRSGGRLLLIDMMRHDRREYQQQMGHVWLGFDEAQVAGWLDAAGFEKIRIRPVTPVPDAKGPNLFAASARRAAKTQNPKRRTKHE